MSFWVLMRMDLNGESSSCARPDITVKESDEGGFDLIIRKTRLAGVEPATFSSVD